MYEGLKNLEVPRKSRRPRDSRARAVGRTVLGVVVAFAIAATAVGTYTYIRVKNNLGRGVDERLAGLAESAPEDPLNILIVGSDSRAAIDKAERKENVEYRGPGGQRADTIILLHVSGDEKKRAVLVHFPRDLRVDIPGYGTNKINAAYAFGEMKEKGGGANLLIDTVKEFSGLDIHHYVEVNFASFRQIVDAVGGVKIYVNRKLKDKKAGLSIPRAGCYEMDGKTALAFVRARNIDPTADLGRIQRQQLFMRALLRKVRTVSFLLDPGKVIRVSREVGRGLRYNAAAADIDVARAVAAKVAGFDQRRVDFRMVPGDPQYLGGVSYVIAREREARKFFAAIAADGKLPPFGKTAQSVPEREDVTVGVLNGTEKSGLAGREGRRLRKAGFSVTAVANARNVDRTVITYQAGADLKADLVARYYKGAQKQIATEFQGPDVLVTLGADRLVPSGSPTPKKKTTQRKSARAACV